MSDTFYHERGISFIKSILVSIEMLPEIAFWNISQALDIYCPQSAFIEFFVIGDSESLFSGGGKTTQFHMAPALRCDFETKGDKNLDNFLARESFEFKHAETRTTPY